VARRPVLPAGDGKCLFRSLVLGLASSKGVTLSARAEELEADQLRAAVADAMCRTVTRREDFPEAVIAIKDEFKSFNEYCKRLQSPTFWGGSAELLVLTALLRTPVTVYLQPSNVLGYRPLITFGQQFELTKTGKVRKPIKL